MTGTRWRDRPREPLVPKDGPSPIVLYGLALSISTIGAFQFLAGVVTRDGVLPRLRALTFGLTLLAVAAGLVWLGVAYVRRPVVRPPRPTVSEPPGAREAREAREAAERRAWRSRGSA